MTAPHVPSSHEEKLQGCGRSNTCLEDDASGSSKVFTTTLTSEALQTMECCNKPSSASDGDSKVSSSFSGSENSEELSPEALIKTGKSLLKSRLYDDAVDAFSEAVELKLRELGGEEFETDPAMAQYYLEYGDALLQKAENSSDLFKLSKQSETSQPSRSDAESSAEPRIAVQPCALENSAAHGTGLVATDTVPDEQVSWEILELARLCYSKVLADYEQQGALPLPDPPVVSALYDKPRSAALDAADNAAFVYLRLGDILMAEEQYSAASAEYEKALDVYKRYRFPYPAHLPPTVALAQALLFENRSVTALDKFKEALQLVTDQIKGVGDAQMSSVERERFVAVREDLEIQIQELQESLTKQQQATPSSTPRLYTNEDELADPSRKSSSSLLARAGIHKELKVTSVADCFDQPQLNSSVPVFDFGVVQRGKTSKPLLDPLEQIASNKRQKVTTPTSPNEKVE